MFNDVIELIAVTIMKDELGQEIENELARTVFCERKSIAQNEFFQAASTGIKASHVFILNELDYADELKVRYRNKDYSVYRTYLKGETIELYCEVRVGAN